MIWGKHTWIFFHTLVEKLKDDKFHQHKDMICNMIINLCSCLPCPTCKDHAMETLRKKNIYAVRSKHELKIFLYQFHNTVSHTKGMPTPDLHILDQYQHSNIRVATRNFAQHFTTNAPSLMTQQMKRRAVVAQTLRTLHQNWHIFEN